MRKPLTTLALATVITMTAPAGALAGGAIHGTVFLTSGETLTGELRWDRNENFWDDRLDAIKVEELVLDEEPQETTFTFLGIRLPRWGNHQTRVRHQFSIPFGHLSALEPVDEHSAMVHLKNGEVIEVHAGSTDLGAGMRGLRLTPAEGEPVELTWAQLRRIEFSASPHDTRDESRIYGTVETTQGSVTGFVVWDRDESMLTDILDGEDEEGERDVPFQIIAVIARESADASRVTTHDGEEWVLEGTNDVNEDNRGIRVSLPAQGTVEVSWDDFVRLQLKPAPLSPAYGSFDGGGRIHGTLTTADGQQHQGLITWDLDEQYTWETLDGHHEELDYAIPFLHIARIEHGTRQGSLVQLRDGTSMSLRGTNDVSAENKGIVVEKSDGSRVEVDWEAFQSLVLDDGRGR